VPRGIANPRLLLRGRDGKFATGIETFGAALAKAEINSVQLPHRLSSERSAAGNATAA